MSLPIETKQADEEEAEAVQKRPQHSSQPKLKWFIILYRGNI
ncbi:hypothetical protein PR003_g22876 [Phytophthora rubi]|uniref:Uncharacterized protein n=2 Tax=Phytophthora TaxID=4783 RepID=A0A6A3IVY0_9STRA|nr:hypothetical protein PR002_g22110 [Phytophthora rubi]KAE8989602.1 hypothetical protein PR001_g21734 [Phytophthora rubi]KAE9295007.1 hypothetical protein PF008_g24387 [Phytophthora fragariae]KAE9299911.1 hypothetical protein PR003_g22876 [Phytophthora rubi]